MISPFRPTMRMRSSSPGRPSVSGTIAESVAALYFGRDVASPDVALAPNPEPMDPRLTGSYEVVGRPWTFNLSLRDGRPVIAWTEIRQSALRRIDADTWFSPLDWAKLTLRFRPDGTFDGAIAMSPSDITRSLSNRGKNIVPLLTVFQIPPVARAT